MQDYDTVVIESYIEDQIKCNFRAVSYLIILYMHFLYKENIDISYYKMEKWILLEKRHFKTYNSVSTVCINIYFSCPHIFWE